MSTAHEIAIPESSRSSLRERSLDEAGRILRFAGWYAAALALDRADPDALAVPGGRVVRVVRAFVINEGAPKRSLRRASLRYAALKLRQVGGPEGAARFLEGVAADDGPGSYIATGSIASVPRHRVPVGMTSFPVDGDEDGDDAERTMFLSRDWSRDWVSSS